MMPGHFKLNAEIGHTEPGLQVGAINMDVIQDPVCEFLKWIIFSRMMFLRDIHILYLML